MDNQQALRPKQPITILSLEDSILDYDLICLRLNKENIEFTSKRVETEKDFVQTLIEYNYDLILSDYNLPDFDGLKALEIARAQCPDVPFIFVSGALGEDIAIESLKLGAVDYVTKQKLERLGPAVVRALREANEKKARQQSELALQQSEERWRTLTEVMPQLVWVDRASDGWCEYLSSQWEQYSGVKVSELLGFNWLSLLHPEDKQRAAEAWQAAVADKADYNIEYRIRRYDGEYRWFKTRGVPVRDEKGKIQIWYGTCTDIHDLKLAEAKAEAASRAKSEFLANMSHEIRTPMNAVIGLASILAMDKTLPKRQKELVETLHLSAQSLLGLINDLLDISKIETNKVDLEHIPFQLSDIFEETINIYRVKAQEKNITLNHVSRAEEQTSYLGDPQRIRQVVTNLVSNAIKFTEFGGVTIHCEVTPHEDSNMDYVHIHVRDTGIGIPSDKLATIFDKFTQADSSTTRKYGGTGLGLAICKNLAEIMSGGISVKSEKGGSEFVLHLPLERAKEDALPIAPKIAAKNPDKKANGHDKLPPTVLLVEDHAANVLVATQLLQSLGYSCDVASNGKEALAKLRVNRSQYQAILMDVQMPGMDGLETTRIIRQEEQTSKLQPITIIAMTAFAMVEDRERCFDAGMNDYISKPFRPEELEKKLREYELVQ